MVRFGIGKRSLDMAEEFTFEKGFSNRTGIHADHCLVGTSGKSLDFMGQDILSGSVLTCYEHSSIGRSYTFHIMPELLHLRSFTPEHLRPVIDIDTCPCIDLPVPDSRQGLDQFGIVPRLDDEIRGSAFHSFDGQCYVRVSRKQYHRHLRPPFLEF